MLSRLATATECSAGWTDGLVQRRRPHVAPRVINRTACCVVIVQVPPHISRGLVLTWGRVADTEIEKMGVRVWTSPDLSQKLVLTCLRS